ncbi:AAA domain-containing protein [Dysosmobacter sp. HCP28S3_G4]|uniref:AAA domain-containing protein n=1 Tax=Dysosmobacter sp. HCP28S3_G4 TaxID=3438938 RepID=UPI003F8A7E13
MINDKNRMNSTEDKEEIDEEIREGIELKVSSLPSYQRDIVRKILNNQCAFSAYVIDRCFELVHKNGGDIYPGEYGAPEYINFIDKTTGEKYCANITYISYSEDEWSITPSDDAIISLIFQANSSNIDEDTDRECNDDIVALDLDGFYRSKGNSDVLYYTSDDPEWNNQYDSIWYNLNESRLLVNAPSPVAPNLAPALKYYNTLLRDLTISGTEYNFSASIDLKLFRQHYDVFKNLIPNESVIVLPIKAWYSKGIIKSISLLTYNYDSEISQDDSFFEGTFSPLEESSYFKALKENGVLLPAYDELGKLDMVEMSDKASLRLIQAITDSKVESCEIQDNINGEKVRLRRIVLGIKNVLLEKVANPKLVELICSNDFQIQMSSMPTYVQDADYVEQLKKEYPLLRDNGEQLEAVDKIMQMEKNNTDVMLIQGPPGTGKTELILSLAKELMKAGKTVLITSNVHVACDNIVERLKNNKDFALKNYTAVRGDQYEAEFVENQRRYIKNQVLACFEYEDQGQRIPVASAEAYKVFGGKIDNLLEKKSHFLDEKQAYQDKLQKYADLIKKQTDRKVEIIQAKTNLEKMNHKKAEIEELLSRQNAEIEQKKRQLEDNRAKAADIEKTLSDLENKFTSDQDKLSVFYKQKTEFTNSIAAKYADIQRAQDDIQHFRLEMQTLNGRIELLSGINCEKVKSLVYKNVFEGEAFPAEIIADIDLSSMLRHLTDEISPLAQVYRILQKDNDFWEGKSDISNATLDFLYFSFKSSTAIEHLSSFIDKEVLLSIGEIYEYTQASDAQKSVMSVFAFIKFKGHGASYYQNLVGRLNHELKRIKFCLPDFVSSCVIKYYNAAHLENMIQFLHKEIIRRMQKVSDSEAIIRNSNAFIEQRKGDIEDIKRTIDEHTKLLFSQQDAICTKRQAHKDIVSRTDDILSEIADCSQDAITLSNDLCDADQSIAVISSEIQHKQEEYIQSGRVLAENYSVSRVSEYRAAMDRLDAKVSKIDKVVSSWHEVLRRIDDRVQILCDNHWGREDAYSVVLNYIQELNTIAESDDSAIKRYFDGRGQAFNKMFDIRSNEKGSLISMTTSQVARLLNNTTVDLSFDYAIVDEASKCRFEDIIISLPKVKHLVLIGDFMQLDPMYKNYKDIDLVYQNMFTDTQWDDLNKSTFSKLLSQLVQYNESNGIDGFESNPCVAVMKKQYRMNREIFDIIAPIYSIHKGFDLIDEKKTTYNDVMCINIEGKEDQPDGSTSYSNIKERDAIVSVLKALKEKSDDYPNIKTIGVITGYRQQEKAILKGLKSVRFPHLEIGTFDRFQGREYDLVIVSLVRTDRLGFTQDIRRMNVAFSRAKSHLLVFGNFDALNRIALKTHSKASEECSNETAAENNFVANVLIPKLYGKRETFVSERERTESILNFIKENDDE